MSRKKSHKKNIFTYHAQREIVQWYVHQGYRNMYYEIIANAPRFIDIQYCVQQNATKSLYVNI